MTIVMPAIPPKGAKNQLRRETGVPAPYPSSAEWMEKGRTGVGPIVAAVSRRHSNESRLFSSPGRPGQTMTPLTGRAAFSLTLRLSQWFEIHKPPVDSSRPVSANNGHWNASIRPKAVGKPCAKIKIFRIGQNEQKRRPEGSWAPLQGINALRNYMNVGARRSFRLRR